MKRNWFILAFFAFWLCGWTYGGLQVLHHLLLHFELFSAFWMAGWALGEIWVVIACLRMLGGRDVVSLESNQVELRKEIFGVGASNKYLGQQMWNLRFQPEMGAGRSHRDSGMAFDYGAKTITFASGLDEAEANQLVTLIKQRCNLAETLAPSDSTVRFWQAR